MLMRTHGDGALAALWFAAGPVRLMGNLDVPAGARGIVLCSMGKSDHTDTSSTEWIEELRAHTLASLCFDLLTSCEKSREQRSTGNLFIDIPLLRTRWLAATRWALAQMPLRSLPLGYLAGNGSAAAALSAATRAPAVRALVCADAVSGVLDADLKTVRAPTLILATRDDRGSAAHRAAEWFERHL